MKMFRPVHITNELTREREKLVSEADVLVFEAQKILNDEKYTEKNILNHLKSYNKSFGLLNEEGLDKQLIFTRAEIKSICIRFRLRFVDSDAYTGEFPYESILKIKDLNSMQGKDLKYFKVISSPDTLKNPSQPSDTLLFAETVYGNYYLIHRWGKAISGKRKWKYLPVRTIETVMLSMLFLSGLITLLLPNSLITTDTRAEYFSMYRIACFFHVLILNTGFVVFYIFKKNIPFSSSCWDSKNLK